jgi:hypothetical protein
MSEVFYLFLLLIIVYITTAVYLLLSKNKPTLCRTGLLDSTYTQYQGLNRGIFFAIHSCNFKLRVLPKEKKAFLLESQVQHCSLNCHFIGFTSTSMGSKDSFLPHLGHFPSYCWRTSSGGLRSAPSYSMWLHPLQMTRCGTHFTSRNNKSNMCDIFIGY